MLNFFTIGILLFYLTGTICSQQKFSDEFVLEKQKYRVFYSAADTGDIINYIKYFDEGIAEVESFFNRPLDHSFDLVIHANRESLNSQWSEAWGIPEFKSQCWMVGSGVADRFDLLSPRMWDEEACEHEAGNVEEIKKLIAHELTHVYHGQINDDHNFEKITDLGWFIEGTAVLISGQFDGARLKDLKSAAVENKLPSELETAWSGNLRYGICGSIIDFIDKEYGRDNIFKMLKIQTKKQAMEILQTSEDKFIAEWKEYVDNLEI